MLRSCEGYENAITQFFNEQPKDIKKLCFFKKKLLENCQCTNEYVRTLEDYY